METLVVKSQNIFIPIRKSIELIISVNFFDVTVYCFLAFLLPGHEKYVQVCRDLTDSGEPTVWLTFTYILCSYPDNKLQHRNRHRPPVHHSPTQHSPTQPNTTLHNPTQSQGVNQQLHRALDTVMRQRSLIKKVCQRLAVSLRHRASSIYFVRTHL